MTNTQAILSLIYGKVINPGPAGLSVSNFTLAPGGREYVEVIQFLFDAINSQQTLTEIDCQHVFSCYLFLSHSSLLNILFSFTPCSNILSNYSDFTVMLFCFLKLSLLYEKN